MPKASIEKAVCEKCGVDVRENTVFCYNCGSSLSKIAEASVTERNRDIPVVDVETQAALDDLAKRFKIDDVADGKLAQAAAERKKARGSQRKLTEFRWEPREDVSAGLLILMAIMLTAITAAAVYVVVFWK